MRTAFRVSLGILVLLATAWTARADFITAYGWVTTEALVNSPTGATQTTLNDTGCAVLHPGEACTTSNADVSFTTSGINFGATGATIATWVASNSFPVNNLVDSVPGVLMDPTIWLFVGNASFTSPDSFDITHDDGATLVINGQTVINQPGPTSPVVTTGTYTGPAGGSLPFSIIYAECCGGPAVLQTDLVGPENAPVPEPGTVALMGAALLGIAVLRRKLRRA